MHDMVNTVGEQVDDYTVCVCGLVNCKNYFINSQYMPSICRCGVLMRRSVVGVMEHIGVKIGR